MSNEKKETETVEIHRFADKQAYIEALEKSPAPSFIDKRAIQYDKNGNPNKWSEYIPIAITQAIADAMFSEWDVIDIKCEKIINEFLVTCKIQYLPDYPNAEYRIVSGIGAKPITCRKGSDINLFPKGKITNALEFNSGAALSNAETNALGRIGNVFGRNLNRQSSNGFSFKPKNKDGK